MPAATLKIFLVFGDPKRLRTAELSNWTGKAVAAPRSEFDRLAEREEVNSTGVYFLTGINPESNENSIYIGEAESVKTRLKDHLSKDFWNHSIFFISKDDNLTKAHIRYLEGRLIQIAKNANRVAVMNSQGSGAKLPESDREEMEIFLEKMQQVLPALGVDAFVQNSAPPEEKKKKQKTLICKIKDAKATGYLTPNVILVLAGSSAVLNERSSAQKWPSVMNQRNKLIEEKVLVQEGSVYVFKKDTEFSSPSAAAATIHGGSANGLTAWTNQSGKSLKEMEEA